MQHRFLIGAQRSTDADGSRINEQLATSLRLEGRVGATDWDRQHADYSGHVFSVTQDPGVRSAIADATPRLGLRDVLVPGCGSVVELQRALLELCPGVERMVCTDVSSRAIEVARGALEDPRVRFEVQDTSQLDFPDGSFDQVVVVNSILSASDHENRKMVQECSRVLRTNGRFVGLFPTVFAAFEISHLDPDFAGFRDTESDSFSVDVATNSFFEAKQGMRQLFYTPLRLRRIVHEAGLRLGTCRIVFFDGPHFTGPSGANRYYGLPVGDRDLVIYELLVVATRDAVRAV